MADRAERGVFGLICLSIGGGCLLVAAVGVLNTAFDLELALSVYGTTTELPASYDEVVGLAAVGLLIVGLTLFGGLVRRKFAAAQGRPWVRVGILVAAAGSLVLAGRGLQVLVLVHTYGSMLAYYATDGDLDDVRAELARHPDRATLDAAVSRAAQYDNEAALALLLDAGADLRAESSRRRCALLGRSHDFIKTALDRGVGPEACPNGQAAIYDAVEFGTDDAEVARTVALLIGAGWSATVTGYDGRTAVELAERKRWAATLQVLRGS